MKTLSHKRIIVLPGYGWLIGLLLAALVLTTAYNFIVSPAVPGAFSQFTTVQRSLMLAGWLGEIALLALCGRGQLSPSWLGLLGAFGWLSGLRFLQWDASFWAGLAALIAVACALFYLPHGYEGRKYSITLPLSGIFCGLAFVLSPGTGLCITVGVALFSLLHCFLHEREERGVTYRQVSNQQVLRRWAAGWGIAWALPLLICGVVLKSSLTTLASWMPLAAQSIPDSGFGYFATFHHEFREAFRPLAAGHGDSLAVVALACGSAAMHLLSLGLLPILGIVGVGNRLLPRFVYRLLRQSDEEELLLWLGGAALIISTLLYSSAASITAVGGLAFLLGALALQRWANDRPQVDFALKSGFALFLALLWWATLTA